MPFVRRLLPAACCCGALLLGSALSVYAEAGKGLGNTNWGAIFLATALIAVFLPFIIGALVFLLLDVVGRLTSSHRGKLGRCVSFACFPWFSGVALGIALTMADTGRYPTRDGYEVYLLFEVYVLITLGLTVTWAAIGYYTRRRTN